MHLLLAKDAPASLEGEAVDLDQSPADIVFLSFADTELALLSAAAAQRDACAPSLRLASLLQLQHPMSIDLYLEKTIAGARLVIVRLIGGRSYWAYGVEQLSLLAGAETFQLALLPGDDREDEELRRLSTVDATSLARLQAYLVEGGLENGRAFLSYAHCLLEPRLSALPPLALPKLGFYRQPDPALVEGEIALIVFYRALMQSGDTAPVDALIEALAQQGIQAAALFVTSLREPQASALVAAQQERHRIGVVLNMTGFALGGMDERTPDPLQIPDCPILQVILSSESEESWITRQRGLVPRDLAMSVALPEIDGRLLVGVVSFKSVTELDPVTQIRPVRHHPRPDRIARVASSAAAWLRLRRTQTSELRVALILGNYPPRDGRIANAVGLDAPASLMVILQAMADQGYDIRDCPASAADLMTALRAGVTSDAASLGRRQVRVRFEVERYRAWLAALPEAVSKAVDERWGDAATDPFVVDGAFSLPVLPLGNLVVGLQPSRAPGLDPNETFHSQDLVPPHAYLAFYAWIQNGFDAHALVHIGKHGSLEWLPGKALALSADCWPEILLNSIPIIYPFIVNDPGEGAQAKRRLGAVIVDHLTPPLARAGTNQSLAPLERLLDEYAQAQSLDPTRAERLCREIFDFAQATGLARDLQLDDEADPTNLTAIDRHLCDLKELQIRDGLHVFGRAPAGHERAALLLALSMNAPADRARPSLMDALVTDLGLDAHDPFEIDPATTWDGPRPDILTSILNGSWRHVGHTRQRLERLALALLAKSKQPSPSWRRTVETLAWLEHDVANLLDSSASDEIANLMKALEGRRIPPGPSGAPTRGRLDVLPTGRNFYSVDTRAVPTPAAWEIGWASANAIIDRYLQQHGVWPRQIALSVWGTANMRTGGDDIAQALAFLGCRPVWDTQSYRVTGVEVMPLAVLGRPRIDVLLRISGFFRDAFPAQIELLDDAIRAIANLDEPPDENPLAATARATSQHLQAEGLSATEANRIASFRIFGSPPASYGTGIQEAVDQDRWRDEGNLAALFIRHGAYAYGRGSAGRLEESTLVEQLRRTQLVIQNQDNREHDLLDSDGYYQFAGGMALAVRSLSGRQPEIVHADHSHGKLPHLRSLKEELARIVRGRASNPKWIRGIMLHGYRGASEIAATVDFLHAFAATSGEVESHHFDILFDAYLQDDEVRTFLKIANQDALREIASRFRQSIQRGFWQPRRNSAVVLLDELLA
ncbi:cobaltochelatase CobN subunit [Arboricoccus pini]|uniref:Cobaltochelatase subunit CobN n=1 Tax=Arboricoccus pini TaxID=1963835 RepID=A0A212QNH4_9PROT|nr:cobaltochelatase subunit CobN [Arboricoccus pini]SNB60872.1 cobaltochelatase CobN subunit [Arboricoccus pini]